MSSKTVQACCAYGSEDFQAVFGGSSINQSSVVLSEFCKSIKIASTVEELEPIIELRKQVYQELYPEVSIADNDQFDSTAYVLYDVNEDGMVNGTARLVLDSKQGLPEDFVFNGFASRYRENNILIAELGRFIILESSLSLLKQYYRAFYDIALQKNVHSIFMVMREKDIAFHKKNIGALTLQKDIGNTFGSKHNYACVEWKISETKERFIKWCGKSGN